MEIAYNNKKAKIF